MKPGAAIAGRAGVVVAALVVCAWARPAFADGGRLRFREPAGPFVVTLFTTPDPLTQGHADFSVAMERAGEPGLVEDAQVEFLLAPADGHGRQFVVDASHVAATSKWLQAANFSFPAKGLWRVKVVVRRGQEMGECSGEVRVRLSGTSDLLWDVLPVPLAGLVFLLHQERKRRYGRERAAATHSVRA